MLHDCCANLHEKITRQLNHFIGFDQAQDVIKGAVIVSGTSGRSSRGRSTTMRLYSRTLLDPNTGKGVLSGEASFRNGKNTKHDKIETTTYSLRFQVEPEFGTPGAIVVTNGGRMEFFLRSVVLQMSDGGSVHFDCNSWVYPVRKTNSDRIFFANTSFLPIETPQALQRLRQEELVSLRGNGAGERKEWERVYDYDRYNDLGEPDKGEDHARPVLGGSKAFPYPRRCRTGRPLGKDGKTEVRNKLINLDFYVPPDDRFSPVKLSAFISNSMQAVLHFVVPEVKSLLEGDARNFESFDQITKDLYRGDANKAIESVVTQKLGSFLPEGLFQEILRVAVKGIPVKFPIPQVIAADNDAWRSDAEFAREMLAGLNPAVIRRLEKFPPEERGGRMSSITTTHIANDLDGLTVTTALSAGRIFILDHHDYLMPYLKRINQQGVCAYASRTLLFLKDDGTLKPLAIELCLPEDVLGEDVDRVFLPAKEGTPAALWQLAKTHVVVNDSGYHQLISHWLHTHAAVEPFIIATRRQLSAMHPIYKLLDPHFKDTLHINSLARSVLLNSGGVLERTMFVGKSAMEISSKIYKSWRFVEQGLPSDLLKRGLAVEDPAEPSGVRLLFKDYPYAADGLDVWVAIKTWVTNYCGHFYRTNGDVASDAELQSWWKEIREVGHGDKRYDADCWVPLDSLANLALVLTTVVWIASALHAAVNFGQWGYAGFPLNRPTRCRKFIPDEGTPGFVELLRDPDEYFLRTVPDRFTTTLGLALIEVLSGHAADEVYLGQRAPSASAWTDDMEVRRMFEEFGASLRQVERRIEERNKDPSLRNRYGPAKVPYTLLYPDTSNVGAEKGVTGKGIPNSVSI